MKRRIGRSLILVLRVRFCSFLGGGRLCCFRFRCSLSGLFQACFGSCSLLWRCLWGGLGLGLGFLQMCMNSLADAPETQELAGARDICTHGDWDR